MSRVKSTFSNMYMVFCVTLIVLGVISLTAIIMGIRPFVMVSESMYPEIPKDSIVLLDTNTPFNEIEVGQNIAYILGKFETMHKVTVAGKDELIVKSLVDNEKSVVGRDIFLGREIMSIPGVGGWVYTALHYRWIVIIIAISFIVWGCVPQGKEK